MKVGLTGKIWMAMSILIGGFLLIIGMEWKNSYALGKRLNAVKAGYFPAVASGTEVHAKLKQLLDRYRRAVILGDPSLFHEAGTDPDMLAIQDNLTLIAHDSSIDPKQREEANALLEAIGQFTEVAEPKYKRLSEGEEPVGELGPESMARYAAQQDDLKNRAQLLKNGMAKRFEAELSLVYIELTQQQKISTMLILVVTLLAGGTAFLVINRYIKRPIQLTVRAANSIADGNFSKRLSVGSNDEVGDLGRAFNKMAQNLEVTLLGLQQEIAERTRTQEALQTNEENLRITLDSIGDAVIATDCDGTITRFNPVASKVTGWKPEDAIGDAVTDVLNLIDPDGDKPVQNPIERVLGEGTSPGIQYVTLLAKNGDKKQIAESGSPILNAKGETVGVVLVFRDITEQLMRDEQLNQARKMDSIGQLAGGIAHDFNNMLGAIIGACEYMRDKVGDDKKREDMVGLILRAAEQASGLTQKLLAFSRKGKIHPVELDLHSVMDEVVSLLERSIDKRIQLICEKNAELSTVLGDRSQLINALINLGVNSRDALPNGGTIRFVTEAVELSTDDCDASPFDLEPGPYVKLMAIDDGVGIPQAVQAKVFDPFFTTKEVGSGTGLGLAAVYGCIKDHHGAVSMQSTEGVGTTFEILLPAVECKNPVNTVESAPLRKGSGCILIVDDEAVMRRSISLLLEELGYDYLTANDGEDALRVFTEKRDLIDLVLLDMIMPKMDGADCLAGLLKIDPNVKVIIASGYADLESIKTVKELGVCSVITKPFRLADLGNAIGDSLALSREGVNR